ncbi:unnamed protein product [Protopolystoma xenopodis]|uniref:Uncharacterized protein n=1 Tax=Protopolystoma xenopodis TaxID=117903 RepID=A0A448XQC5_9PLAT|nr:unnamed protein product [Protopolystoma xenopodis]
MSVSGRADSTFTSASESQFHSEMGWRRWAMGTSPAPERWTSRVGWIVLPPLPKASKVPKLN